MKQYLDLLNHVLQHGETKDDRTNTGTKSLFGYQMRFDLAEGFPLLTTKKVHLKSIIHELLWMLSGETNIKYLADNHVSIWDDWPFKAFQESDEYNGESIKEFAEMVRQDDAFAKRFGDLGPVYGYQWRYFESHGVTVDQIERLIEGLKNNPNSRRHIVSAWNPAQIDSMALPPCHSFFQFYVVNNKLSCQLYQRSADIFLGVPFNIAFYSLLTMMIATTLGFEYGDFVHTLGDAHIYSNHFTQVKEQLSREPRALPTMNIQKRNNILDYTFDDFELVGYDPHPRIKAEVAV